MSEPTMPGYSEVATALDSAVPQANVAEAHGVLCGCACLMGAEATAAWVDEVLQDSDPANAQSAECSDILKRVAGATWHSLEEGDMSLRLMLPGDEEPLEIRTEGLAAWCEGFMHGLGLGQGSLGETVREALEAGVVREILEDFSELSRAAVEEGADDGESEAAYTELIEYVRVSAQLVFEEFHALRSSADQSRHH